MKNNMPGCCHRRCCSIHIHLGDWVAVDYFRGSIDRCRFHHCSHASLKEVVSLSTVPHFHLNELLERTKTLRRWRVESQWSWTVEEQAWTCALLRRTLAWNDLHSSRTLDWTGDWARPWIDVGRGVHHEVVNRHHSYEDVAGTW